MSQRAYLPWLVAVLVPGCMSGPPEDVLLGTIDGDEIASCELGELAIDPPLTMGHRVEAMGEFITVLVAWGYDAGMPPEVPSHWEATTVRVNRRGSVTDACDAEVTADGTRWIFDIDCTSGGILHMEIDRCDGEAP